jgi:Ca2+-binding EF-hand superfamily protein
MLRRTKRGSVITITAVLIATWAMPGTVVAQKAAVPKPQEEVKQILLLMDADENGKISKQEWIKFMEAEFDRLDRDKKGQLDAKEVAQSKLRVSRFVSVGK